MSSDVFKTVMQMINLSNNKDGKAKGTIAESILRSHHQGPEGSDHLNIRFDKLTSHDITYVGIIQTARASGLKAFPMPYVLTNCHNSLCAVGGTINEDDHLFGLSAAKKYGGIFVPPHQAVIHQYAREMLAECGSMILGSDSHTRYGALGCMAVGEGGPELVKQLLGQTWDIPFPEIVAVRLTGVPKKGVGPQDVALALIGAVFKQGFVKNKVLEFIGDGVANLSVDFRIGIDVMTTETTCLSSIWQTDERVKEFFRIHGSEEAYRELKPAQDAVYDAEVEIDLSSIVPMIAMPFHPSNVYPIAEVIKDPEGILAKVEEEAKGKLGDQVTLDLVSRIKDGKLMADQGIIAGCAGGGFENICAAADILKGKNIGDGAFSLSVYPASTPIYMELLKNGAAASILQAGGILKTAFCGPCFGAGDTPANQAFSIRHSTRNFPNREGSKPGNGQISSVALMDARSIAATAANGGILTPADEFDGSFSEYTYFFDERIYAHRVYDGWGKAKPEEPLILGPNIKDWPEQPALPENLLLKLVSYIDDPVTTTDELIPSGETSSYRSNPLGLAEFTLSRRDPAYVGRAKEVRDGEPPEWVKKQCEALLGTQNSPASGKDSAGANAQAAPAKERFAALGYASAIFANKPGDGSAREQAASCQRVLGGGANIAREYATKRYRSNLINWGMLPLVLKEENAAVPFKALDHILLTDIRETVSSGASEVKAFVLSEGSDPQPVRFLLGELTGEEREILLAGCLINYNRR